MKKLIALFLCLCLMAGIVPVVAENTAVTHEITSASYPFHLGATVLGEVPLYFLDGANDMPYIDAESMHAVISSVMNSATGNFNYTINIEGSIVTLTRNNLKTPGDVVTEHTSIHLKPSPHIFSGKSSQKSRASVIMYR